MAHSRRDFLRGVAGAGFWGATGGFNALLTFSPLSRAEDQITPDIVQLRPEIEPLVRLIEQTSREKCVDMLVGQLRRGVSYRQFLAALFLAGVRNVNPLPLGFGLHSVFVIHSAHLMSLDAPVGERLLPLFYALDYFKEAQAYDAQQRVGDFVMRPITSNVPPPERAPNEFHAAMEAWDKERAERAIIPLVRHRGASEVIETLWRYGARDYRRIGHKAIYVTNAWRTLQTIGWQHAEPVLRSVVVGLLDGGKDEQVDGYTFEDQCYLPNVRRVKKAIGRLKPDWTEARGDVGVARNMLDAIRTGTGDRACGEALSHLLKGQAQAGTIWDAVHLAAGELMMQKPGSFMALHAVTSANALRHAYLSSGDAETRLLLLLQAVGWMGQFKKTSSIREKNMPPRHVKITEFAPADIPADTDKAMAETFAEVSTNPDPAKSDAAAGKAFRFARDPSTTGAFMRTAKRLIFIKGNEPHDYKYAAAVFEDYRLVSPEWQPHMLATAAYYLKGSTDPDSPLMQRAREAVRSLGG